MQKPDADDSLVVSYLSLRKAVGFIGFTLPFVLAIGKILSGNPGIEPSISHYYYTNMGDFLVGSLCAIGVFLMSTRGYPTPKLTAGLPGHDHIAGILASIFAIGVALFPTSYNEDHLTGTVTSCLRRVALPDACLLLHRAIHADNSRKTQQAETAKKRHLLHLRIHDPGLHPFNSRSCATANQTVSGTSQSKILA